ncbi:hypothetical protein [Pseudonocardia sp. EV170527-09]|uniref:hypothetical protein n=1 Tax=Pseudonocardia sp. EV170527-09 TaxID=2603411 RepID=UPI001F01E85E|nr:hypothetical protein [Pseudonocardia sp. EV170527-09]
MPVAEPTALQPPPQHRVIQGSITYTMIGVRTIVVTASRGTTGQSAISAPRVTVASRFIGKKTSQIVVACFQRGGVIWGGPAVSTAAGWSNQPSMPVRRSARVISARPWAEPSHQRRSGLASQRPSDSGESKRASMCHSSEPSRLRTQPPPRKPGNPSAMSRPARIQAVISAA